MHWGEPGWLILLVLVPLPWLAARARPRIAWPSLRRVRAVADARRVAGSGACRSPCAAWRSPAWRWRWRGRRRSAGRTRIAGQGVAIVVALDQSSSMNAVDFPAEHGTAVAGSKRPRRRFARFVAGRPDDLIGLVVFANYPDLACPADARSRVPARHRRGRSDRRGPATTGPTSATRSPGRSTPCVAATPKKKVLILLTDGRNSPAVPQPLDPEDGGGAGPRPGRHAAHDRRRAGGGIVRARRAGSPGSTGGPPDGRPRLRPARAAREGRGRPRVRRHRRPARSTRSSRRSTPWRRAPFAATVRTRYREWYAPWVGSALALLALDRILSAGRLRRLP